MVQWLQMVILGYVWIVIEVMVNVMDYVEQDLDFVQVLQGVVGIWSYIFLLLLLEVYKVWWVEFYVVDCILGLVQMNNVYVWYVYDVVWMIVYVIWNFLVQGGVIMFVDFLVYFSDVGGNNELVDLKVFCDGVLFMCNILQFQFMGIIGFVQVDECGDFIGFFFEIFNMVGKGLWMVGFWFNFMGCLLFVFYCNLFFMFGVSYLGYSFKLGVCFFYFYWLLVFFILCFLFY